jgi:Holliday junction resolvasome RuvABC endonuclease subunit
MTTILGLDLSVRAAAAVSVPLAWDGDWQQVKSMVVGEPLREDATDTERARRCETIAMRIVAFSRATGVTIALIENYAFSRRSSSVHKLAELGGIVKLELVRAGIDLQRANMSATRKFLCGTIHRGTNPKVAVHQALRAAGAHFETLDESDAFCAANWGLSEEGGYCLCQNEPSLSASQTRVIRASNSANRAANGASNSRGHNAPCAPPDVKRSNSTARISRKSSRKKA